MPYMKTGILEIKQFHVSTHCFQLKNNIENVHANARTAQQFFEMDLYSKGKTRYKISIEGTYHSTFFPFIKEIAKNCSSISWMLKNEFPRTLMICMKITNNKYNGRIFCNRTF